MPSPGTSSSTSLVANSGIPLIDGLLLGVKWGSPTPGDGAQLSYSFPGPDSVWSPDPGTGYGPDSSAQGEPWVGFAPLSANQQAAATAALQAWANVANLSLTQLPDTASEVGDIRLASTLYVNPGANAHAFAPSAFPGVPKAGDVWLNYDDPTNLDPSPGSYGFLTLLHEIGHTLGLKHPFSTDGSGVTLPPEFDFVAYTVMGYNELPGSRAGLSVYPTTPMPLDILALQYLYGANTDYRAGDDIYTFTEGQSYYQTIWDGGGIDTIQSAGDAACAVDLRPGNWSRLGDPIRISNGAIDPETVTIAFGCTIENAAGGTGDDTLLGNDAENRLEGSAGNDTIMGGTGGDTIIGGAGDDALFGYGSDMRYGETAPGHQDGPDTFVFGADGGHDTVYGITPEDQLLFTGSSEPLLVRPDGTSTLVRYGETTVSLSGLHSPTADPIDSLAELAEYTRVDLFLA